MQVLPATQRRQGIVVSGLQTLSEAFLRFAPVFGKSRFPAPNPVEGTDGQIYHIYRTPGMEELRSQKGLQTNSFILLRNFSPVRGPVVEIKDMGDSEAILTNKAHLRETAREMIRRGLYPLDGGWNGWLGRYQKALVDTAFALE